MSIARVFWLLAVTPWIVNPAWADVRLPRVVGDRMVLQRDAALPLWGWADPGEVLTIAFHGQTFKAEADRTGEWRVSVGPYPAGGPFDLVISAKNRVHVRDILIGDVWLASGQSNMEFPLKPGKERWMTGVLNYDQEAADSAYPNLRLFKVHRTVGFKPAKDVVEADGWEISSLETSANFSAIAFLFGREIHKRYQIPVGLIETSWGNTVAEAWVSAAGLKSFPEFAGDIQTVAAFDGASVLDDPNRATVLFNGMINPLLPFRIRGAIWYQGEANTHRASQYRRLFPALIEDWRRQWGYHLPFLYVQLEGFQPNKPEPAEYQWAELREAQSLTLFEPNTGMATAVDIGDENDVHPRNKQEVAHRLVLAAAKVAYGENLVYSGPTYSSMHTEGQSVRIRFSNLGSGLLVKDKYGNARGFEVAGADGKFRWAQARQDGDDIVVFSGSIRQPTDVRYGWMNTPDGNVYNAEGLPAIPFRTDAPKP